MGGVTDWVTAEEAVAVRAVYADWVKVKWICIWTKTKIMGSIVWDYHQLHYLKCLKHFLIG